MRRRDALGAISAAAAFAAWPAVAEDRVRRIGLLRQAEFLPSIAKMWHDALEERGYIEDRNLKIDYRYFGGLGERATGLAAELAALRPELIVAESPPAAVAVHTAAPEIPLVFVNVGDPVALRLVDSLAHPGGSATGIATIVPEGFSGKLFQLVKELVPHASRVGNLINPSNPMHRQMQVYNSTVEQQLGIKLITVEASAPEQYEPAFAAAAKEGAGAMVVAGDALAFLHSKNLVALAARYRLPAVYFFRQSVIDGGLMSFGPNSAARWQRVPAYVDRILKGERPADLPVEQPTKYEIAINRRTAAALGLAIPPTILAQADEVIE